MSITMAQKILTATPIHERITDEQKRRLCGVLNGTAVSSSEYDKLMSYKFEDSSRLIVDLNVNWDIINVVSVDCICGYCSEAENPGQYMSCRDNVE